VKHPNQLLPDLHFAWPEVVAVRDPHAGDEALALPHRYENYTAFAPPPHLDEAAYEKVVATFDHAMRAVLDGRAPRSTLGPLAVAAGVSGPVRHDRRAPPPAPRRVSLLDLAEITEDWVPDVGVVVERVLGPFANGPLPRWLVAVAAAMLALSPILFPRTRPIDRAIDTRKPRPPVELRASLKAIARAPVSLWRRRGDRWESLLPLAPAFVPEAPMEGPATPFAVGRAVRGSDGWWLAAALPLPAAPGAVAVARRVELELLRARLWERRATWEDVLRSHGEVVARTCCEWCDLHGIDIR
jgi:hypothetical protein